nr:MAG TPA: hypothetical protein [Caudoviricetes sp.]
MHFLLAVTKILSKFAIVKRRCNVTSSRVR